MQQFCVKFTNSQGVAIEGWDRVFLRSVPCENDIVDLGEKTYEVRRVRRSYLKFGGDVEERFTVELWWLSDPPVAA